MIDLVTRLERLPKLGETLLGSQFTLGYGGKGGNQAVMAARLGADVAIVTRIGTDSLAAGVLDNYRANGVDVRYVTRDAQRASGVASIFVDEAANNVIVIVPGANEGLDEHAVTAAAAAIEQADVVVCQFEVPIETVTAAFTVAKRAGVRTILNPAPAREIPDHLLRLTDIVVPNETEAEAITGIAVSDDAAAEQAARALLARGPGAVIITLGKRGSLVVTPDQVRRVAPHATTAIDSTGAGDAYVGTLAVCVALNFALAEAAERANVVAALSVTKVGTQTSYPDLPTAEHALEEQRLSLHAIPSS